MTWSRPRAFIEAPAGLAAVSLRLHGGPHCRPPISRMGNKAGYAEVILAALGLRSGQGADAYVWAEADPDVRALLRAYPDADMLRRIAEIIRGWKDEEPRALWERLRAERKARGPAVEPDEVGGWMFDVANAHGGTGGWKVVPTTRPNTDANMSAEGLGDACHRLAEYASIAPAAEVAGGFERVAGWSTLTAWTKQNDPNGSMYMGPDRPSACHEPGWVASITTDGLGRRYNNLASRWPPVAVLATLPTADELSAMLGTPGDLDGVVVYGDADYRDTTGYAHTCREMMPDLSRGWDAMGAVVCLSEAEPYPELPTWHACEITGGRKGQKRTFSKQQREWLTMNREPQHRVATQAALFGAP